MAVRLNEPSAIRMLIALLVVCSIVAPVRANDKRVAFFERNIRPVLIEHCYSCHNSTDKAKGGLILDHRKAMLAGGDSGEAIVPGKPGESLLLETIRHEIADQKMPKGGPKLSDRVIADFERWIKGGAYDPRDKPPSKQELSQATSWEATRQRRMSWWSFQPLADAKPPAVKAVAWAKHPVDRFILHRIEQAGLTPAPLADKRTLARRLSYVLRGLPPSAKEIETFLADTRPDAYERLVDQWLGSERFGERWARHWMDWWRFAESHGSEGDPAIPEAWRYRDYLIRALNGDVPYDQLLREHVAGDRLEKPRVDAKAGINESAIGTAHLRFVFHGFAPVDALDEQVRFTDDQIDVLSKATLGLTVSCARCHDHKFDPISQRDFYAWYGIFASTRPATVTIDTPERSRGMDASLEGLKGRLRAAAAKQWLRSLDGLRRDITAALDGKAPGGPAWARALSAANKPTDVLWPVTRVRGKAGTAFALAWEGVQHAYNSSAKNLAAHRQRDYIQRWQLGAEDAKAWFRHGSGLDPVHHDKARQHAGVKPAPAGAFHIETRGEPRIVAIYPSGIYTHLRSVKQNGLLTSPRFKVDMKHVYVRVRGDASLVRYAMQNYPRRGTVYPVQNLGGGGERWVRWDMSYWQGDHAYLELATGRDTAILVNNNDNAWFGITEGVLVSDEQVKRNELPRDEPAEWLQPLLGDEQAKAMDSAASLADRYVATLRKCIEAWRDNDMTDAQARFLNGFVSHGLLPNRGRALGDAAALLNQYRDMESRLAAPTRAPGVVEAKAFDQPLFDRGNHKKPMQVVPRGFLEAFGGRTYATTRSGRLELANDLTDPNGDAHRLVSRVIVNRLWHHVFGKGLVATTDNLGRLGEKPTHPLLLDYLARRFTRDGWSIKQALLFLVTSRTFQLSSTVSSQTASRDPGNQWRSHFGVRRLEAEAIRDGILAAAGSLDDRMFGPSVQGNSPRRSVYIRVQRNRLDPFLNAFDAPEPASAVGRRDATNVPAQSLMLLNDGFVNQQAERWAARLLRDESLTDAQRVQRMYTEGLGREPSTGELQRCLSFVGVDDSRVIAAQNEQGRLTRDAAAIRERIDRILGPVRKQLEKAQRAKLKVGTKQVPEGLPRPIARWAFDGDAKDTIGQMHGQLRGGAHLANGKLVLDGRRGFFASAPLSRRLTAKTLEAWVQLDNLSQRGGGVMTLQTLNGNVFDAIVFGEQEPEKWLAGSDFFRRTRSFNAPREADASKRLVHVTITYAADGTITGYRDGKPYGKPYMAARPIVYEAGKAQVLFGLRHGTGAGGNRMLAGRIAQAQLYDKALSADEVAASAAAGEGGVYVSPKQVIAALTDAQRKEITALREGLAKLDSRLAELRGIAESMGDRNQAWRDLALAIFNLKEFIYLR